MGPFLGAGWRKTPYVLSQSGAGWILPGLSAASTASLTSNVVTVVNGGGTPTAHNIPATTFNGYNVYFAGSANIPAGWYPSFAQTTTTAYTFAYTHADVGSESVNGAAAYLAETTAVSVTLPGGAMGLNGSVRFQSYHNWNNSGGAKTVRVKFGGQNVLAVANTASVSGRFDGPIVPNQNSLSSQLVAAGPTNEAIGPLISAGAATTRIAINTAPDVVLLYSLQCAAATDYETLDTYSIVVYPS